MPLATRREGDTNKYLFFFGCWTELELQLLAGKVLTSASPLKTQCGRFSRTERKESRLLCVRPVVRLALWLQQLIEKTKKQSQKEQTDW